MKFIINNFKKIKYFFLGFLVIIPLFSSTICLAQNLLNTPQKIVIDVKRNRLIVSNFITGDLIQIDSSGTQDYFLQGADCVDGIEIVGDTIYGVGFNRIIRAYNLVTKDSVMNVPFAGSNNNYLSSIASDSSGHLFISCPNLNTIYKMRISDQSYWIFAQDNGLNKPNGILLEKEKNRIVIIDDSPSPSKIHAISLLDSVVSDLTTTTFNRPDGIVRDKDGYYYIGGYYLSGLYKIDPDFSQLPVMFYPGNSFVYPTYDPRDHSILVTSYNTNTWLRIPLLTGIRNSDELPKKVMLHQNYPNPFNSSTMLSFELKNRSVVDLNVYNISGKLVRKLINELGLSGPQKVIWDGRDNSGQVVASGIYFYRLKTDDFDEYRRMLLLK